MYSADQHVRPVMRTLTNTATQRTRNQGRLGRRRHENGTSVGHNTIHWVSMEGGDCVLALESDVRFFVL